MTSCGGSGILRKRRPPETCLPRVTSALRQQLERRSIRAKRFGVRLAPATALNYVVVKTPHRKSKPTLISVFENRECVGSRVSRFNLVFQSGDWRRRTPKRFARNYNVTSSNARSPSPGNRWRFCGSVPRRRSPGTCVWGARWMGFRRSRRARMMPSFRRCRRWRSCRRLPVRSYLGGWGSACSQDEGVDVGVDQRREVDLGDSLATCVLAHPPRLTTRRAARRIRLLRSLVDLANCLRVCLRPHRSLGGDDADAASGAGGGGARTGSTTR